VCVCVVYHLHYQAYFFVTNATVFSSSYTKSFNYMSFAISNSTGAILDSSSIEVVNAPEGVEVDNGSTPQQVQFAGNRKLRFTPVDDPSYFFHGQCTATSGILEPLEEIRSLFPDVSSKDTRVSIPQPVITSHLCKLNLCLGGGGFSCIAIYSGSAFVFNLGKGIVLNNGSIPGTDPVDPFSFEAPPLPPPFPGTIIGGTGSFEGIEGSVTIATIAGTTGPLITAALNAATFKGVNSKPIGSIVQVISVKSNMPLPSGP